MILKWIKTKLNISELEHLYRQKVVLVFEENEEGADGVAQN